MYATGANLSCFINNEKSMYWIQEKSVYADSDHIRIRNPAAAFASLFCGVVELEPEYQERQLFALAKPEPKCISVPVLEPDSDLDPTYNETRKSKKSKMRGQLSGKHCCVEKVDL